MKSSGQRSNTVRGRGVPHLRRTGSKGDLHVFVNVVVPAKLSKRQRELLAEYAADQPLPDVWRGDPWGRVATGPQTDRPPRRAATRVREF